MLPGEVEVCERARRVQVGVGVEATHERVRLMAEIAFDLELGLGQRVAKVIGELQPPPELIRQPLGRQVGDVADHASDTHSRDRAVPVVVVPAIPGGIAHDRLPGDRVPGKPLGLKRMGAGDCDDGVDLVRERHRPLECLHPSE